MKEAPLVSVAIITYNQKEFLQECIESILGQDYPNIEIVVADDASNDGSQEMLREYAKKYPGKFLLRLAERNRGITANSNAAHFACTGKYIAWTGGDDLMFPQKISKQVAYMEGNPDCTICYHNLDVFDSDTNETLYFFNDRLKINGTIRESVKYGTFNGACSTMVRREKVPESGYNETIPVASDWLYWVDTLAGGGAINYLDEVLGRYRRHAGNVTRKGKGVGQNKIDHLNSCNIIMTKYPKYAGDAFFSYSNNLMSLRHSANYYRCLWVSFLIRPRVKVFGVLLLAVFSFGNIKL